MNKLCKLAINGGEPIRTQPWPAGQVIDRADEERLLGALRSGTWSAGPATRTFETEFAEFCGVRYCLLVENGTAALRLALQAVGVGPGTEVVIPGMTWPSVAAAVLECGAIPVPVDVDLSTLAMSTAAVEMAITTRTKAIVPTHLFSSQADLPPIIEIAEREKISVIEDCAHVPGARRFRKVLGTFGDAAIFSFNQKKLLACGEGGCLITNDTCLFERAAALRHFDVAPKLLVPGTHLPSEFQAAVLITQLHKLPARLDLMESLAERLRSLLEAIEGVWPLARLPGTDRQTFYNFCFRVGGVRDIVWFRRALAAELNLPMSGGYQPLSEVSALDTKSDPRFRELGTHLRTDLPNCSTAHHRQAIRFRHRALASDEKSIADIAHAVEKVTAFVRRRE
jgi:dTDP-4-amino-4,6-dideoxygalactose transaminase